MNNYEPLKLKDFLRVLEKANDELHKFKDKKELIDYLVVEIKKEINEWEDVLYNNKLNKEFDDE